MLKACWNPILTTSSFTYFTLFLCLRSHHVLNVSAPGHAAKEKGTTPVMETMSSGCNLPQLVWLVWKLYVPFMIYNIIYIYHIQCVYIYTHYIKAWHWILSSSRTNTSNLYEVYWHYLGYVNNSATWKVPPVGYPTPSPIIPVTPRREVVII